MLTAVRDAPAHTITITEDGAQNIAAKCVLNKLQIGREEFTALLRQSFEAGHQRVAKGLRVMTEGRL